MNDQTASSHGALHRLLRRPAVAVIGVAAVVSGAGTAAANDWVQVFQTERVAAVGFDAADLVALPDLRAYGDVEVTAEPNVHRVRSAANATAETGLDVPVVPILPRGVAGEPVLYVGSATSATFTFFADTAEVPPELGDAQVRLAAGPGLVAIWGGSTGAPSLIVGRAIAPTVHSPDVALETVRDHLLSLPGLPDDPATQLEAFAVAGSTMPLPVRTNGVTTSTADVGGVSATVLATNDRTMVAVVWVDDGVATVVAGSMNRDEALSIARSLR